LDRRHNGNLGSAGDEFRVDRGAVDDQVAVEQEVLAPDGQLIEGDLVSALLDRMDFGNTVDEKGKSQGFAIARVDDLNMMESLAGAGKNDFVSLPWSTGTAAPSRKPRTGAEGFAETVMRRSAAVAFVDIGGTDDMDSGFRFDHVEGERAR
jgi:hypothetical protein